jgi:outer membrane protein assembly factor BamB
MVSFGLAWWLATDEEVRLFALSEDDGRVRWSATLPAGLPAVGVPVAGGGRVVVGSARSRGALGAERWQVAAFDAATGRQLWEFAPSSEQLDDLHAVDTVLAAPLVTAAWVYARVESSRGVGVLALDAITGHPAWMHDRAEAAARSAQVDVVMTDRLVAVPTMEGDGLALQALDAQTGAPGWRTGLGRESLPRTDLGPLLAAGEGAVFVGLNGAVVGLEAADGAPRFRIDEPPGQTGGQIWVDGPTLYR